MSLRHSRVLQEDTRQRLARLHTYRLAGNHRDEVGRTLAGPAFAVALSQPHKGSDRRYSPRSSVQHLLRQQLQTAAEPRTANMPLEPDSAVPL